MGSGDGVGKRKLKYTKRRAAKHKNASNRIINRNLQRVEIFYIFRHIIILSRLKFGAIMYL